MDVGTRTARRIYVCSTPLCQALRGAPVLVVETYFIAASENERECVADRQSRPAARKTRRTVGVACGLSVAFSVSPARERCPRESLNAPSIVSEDSDERAKLPG